MENVFDSLTQALINALLAGLLAAGTYLVRHVERFLKERERIFVLKTAASLAPLVVRAAEQIGTTQRLEGRAKFVTADNLLKAALPDLSEAHRVVFIEDSVFDLKSRQLSDDLLRTWTPLEEDEGEAVHDEG